MASGPVEVQTDELLLLALQMQQQATYEAFSLDTPSCPGSRCESVHILPVFLLSNR